MSAVRRNPPPGDNPANALSVAPKVPPLNPRPFLSTLVGQDIIVRLKWGDSEYHGKLVSTDSYMNLQLDNTTEYIDGKDNGQLGMIMIRCNNVLYMHKKDQECIDPGPIPILQQQ